MLNGKTQGVLYKHYTNMDIMGRKSISKSVERKLYAESMGRCMNPDCQRDLFEGGCEDIGEKAHIVSYSETEDNAFENLILLCPNCHKEFDKNHKYSKDELRSWKQIREQDTEKFFGHKFLTFKELQDEAAPLLEENKSIYENYYLGDQRDLWDKFEPKILVNNRKLKLMLQNNLNLIQNYSNKDYSNLEYVYSFINHVDEFEATRGDEEKNRAVLFPKEIDSMFGVQPIKDSFIESTESLEALIRELIKEDRYEGLSIGNDNPYVQFNEEGKSQKLYLLDTPRVRQIYYDYHCFRETKVRFKSLNYILDYLNKRNVIYKIIEPDNLREILIDKTIFIFVYEYVLSRAKLKMLTPEKDSIIVNLHNWNSGQNISKEAFELAIKMGVQLFTTDDFYEYINKIQRST